MIKKAHEELNSFFWTGDDIFHYEREEKRTKDNIAAMNYAIKQARERGIAKGRAKVIAKAKAEGRQYVIDQLVKKGLVSRSEAEKVLKK